MIPSKDAVFKKAEVDISPPGLNREECPVSFRAGPNNKIRFVPDILHFHCHDQNAPLFCRFILSVLEFFAFAFRIFEVYRILYVFRRRLICEKLGRIYLLPVNDLSIFENHGYTQDRQNLLNRLRQNYDWRSFVIHLRWQMLLVVSINWP